MKLLPRHCALMGCVSLALSAASEKEFFGLPTTFALGAISIFSLAVFVFVGIITEVR